MDYRQCPWRTGRSVGRTIYAVVGPTQDVLIGMADTPLLAADVVYAHNLVLAVKKAHARRLTPGEEQEKVAGLHLAMQAEAEGKATAAAAARLEGSP